jgi:glycosyltransferase involved in cell wall biosynthesis
MDVLVGAEPDQFAVVRRRVRQDSTTERAVLKVLFYGQFIPLHGIETIVQAAQLLEHNPAITWTLIGRGQEESKIERILEEHPLPNLRWVKWVEYHELRASIHEADVCLGIFGTSGKASRVIPNKVFQVVSCGKTLITRDSPAIRELISENEAGIFLIPPGDPQALADTLAELSDNRELLWQEPHFSGIRPRISPQEIGNVFKQQILGLIR